MQKIIKRFIMKINHPKIMKNYLLILWVLQTLRGFGQVHEGANLVGGWLIDPSQSCFNSKNLEDAASVRVTFYENGLVRSDFLPNGRWQLQGDFLWIRPDSNETPVDIFHIRADWKQGIFVMDASAVNDATQMKPIMSHTGTCVHTFTLHEAPLNDVQTFLNDSTFFIFWQRYAGNRRDALMEQARKQPDLYQNICETPSKYMQSEGPLDLFKKTVGIWYTQNFTSRKIHLTKTRPQTEWKGLKIVRFYPDNEYLINDFTFDFPSRVTVHSGEWEVNYTYNSLIFNKKNWKVTFLRNGDLLLEQDGRSIEDDED